MTPPQPMAKKCACGCHLPDGMFFHSAVGLCPDCESEPTAQPTARPWKFDDGLFVGSDGRVVDIGGRVSDDKEYAARCVADIELIVRSVNRAELFEEMVTAFEKEHRQHPCLECSVCDLLARAKQENQ